MSDWERQHRQAQRYKEAYPPGTRIMLLSMNDPHHPVESGTRGTVEYAMLEIFNSWSLCNIQNANLDERTPTADYVRLIVYID